MTAFDIVLPILPLIPVYCDRDVLSGLAIVVAFDFDALMSFFEDLISGGVVIVRHSIDSSPSSKKQSVKFGSR